MASFRISPPRALALAAALLALLGLGFFVAAREWQRADKGAEEKGVLADVLSRALSTPATKISIGGIDGALSSDATVRDLKISDRDGVWLTVDRIRIVWRRLALLQRRLEIDKQAILARARRLRPTGPRRCIELFDGRKRHVRAARGGAAALSRCATARPSGGAQCAAQSRAR